MGMERECNNCGATEWTKLLTDDYPERRRERERTVKTVYECDECGRQGRHFDQNSGGEQYSGAMR